VNETILNLEPSTITGVPVARQETILRYVYEHPEKSYVFSGPCGTGKTTLLNELRRLSDSRPVFVSTMKEYQRNLTAIARGGRLPYAFMSPDSPSRMRWRIFLDDFDKCSGSEFIRLELFELIDNVYKSGSQLVLTTNMDKQEFKKFFGDAIAWRITKHCVWVPMMETGKESQ
jgi:DNA replication protein DnaC